MYKKIAPLLKPLWRILSSSEQRYALKETTQPFVIMGFQRSGTSLIGQMLDECGVYFGEDKQLKKTDYRNPRGFFENEEFLSLSRRFMSETGVPGDLPHPGRVFSAQGFIAKIKRFTTRKRMVRFLHTMNTRAEGKPWALKVFPPFWYAWRHYIPRYKMIVVYRDPIVTAESFQKAWPAGKFSFDYVLDMWERAHLDILYHASVSPEVFVLKYEDLFDSEKQKDILKEFVALVGNGDVFALQKILDPSLNRSSQGLTMLKKVYPLSSNAQFILKALDLLKKYEV